jgi:hypothetical protein
VRARASTRGACRIRHSISISRGGPLTIGHTKLPFPMSILLQLKISVALFRSMAFSGVTVLLCVKCLNVELIRA